MSIYNLIIFKFERSVNKQFSPFIVEYTNFLLSASIKFLVTKCKYLYLKFLISQNILASKFVKL